MNYDISESVSQRGSGEETAENRRINEIADELRRRCQLYEAQLRDSQGDVNHLDIEQRVAEQYAKENGIWLPMCDVFDLGVPGPSGNENDTYVSNDIIYKVNNQYECGYDVERDFREPYYADDLRKGLRRLNPMLSDEVLSEAMRKVTHVNEGTLEQRNEQLMDYLQSGVEVKYAEDGRQKTALVRLIDYNDPLHNDFKIANQWRVVEHEAIRCDMVAFVNGLPLVVIELKSPSREETDEEDAYTQIKQYQQKCDKLGLRINR